ncbi:MAG: DNA polymerase III subunit delta' [Curvibacter sp. RIFCSPHIGHO2_12_FULL_63_18]|uniref:DNA polymerase III subunit delta' n=1 Tax=Rhodoferax sp. TaxID=50421 RepID=UPI0008C378F2|nr:DNA polymerase III subunit delta' [Rhodoferax sp.]OGO96884.1 MAG: DNA polymerase III subunit delta' [Curvibacter sp. GWA2_63_95]OGP01062.1 MAG: DNA polymerase III subunit delta' [Curvibacter sp. RIFCSPHIGHO2_12_FULL_63_18]HCX80642.1 DNA polymerase III subunit delta' [Rhodoferax sp.]
MSEPGKNNALAPWIQAQVHTLLEQRGHAWLLQGPSGLGQYPLALALARAWLCENPSPRGACGECGSCHAIEVRTHADLCMLMPETTMMELGWPLSEKAQGEIDDKKRKASKEIRVDAMRDAVEFAQRTSARGRGKVVVVFPAENMNAITANALLKTLEEPAGDVRFVLASESAHQLLPTIRSRCIGHTMLWPDAEEGLQWLQTQGLDAARARLLLQATGGRPADALLFAESGRDPLAWAAFPRAMALGDTAAVKDWTASQIIDAQHKLCHDLMAKLCGATPRFFEPKDLGALCIPMPVLGRWSKALSHAMKTMDHPFNAGLMVEALVGQAQSALNSGH